MRSMVRRAGTALLALGLVLTGCAPSWPGTGQAVAKPEPEAATKARVAAGLAGLPLAFVENGGQLDPRVGYYVPGRDTSVYFTPGGVTLALTGRPPGGDAAASAVGRQDWALKLDFVGADPAVRPVGHGPTPAIVSYFKGDQAEWKAGLPTYGGVAYEELWPGIDLIYAGTQNKLKYSFVVKPGADPKLIKLAYRGATSLEVGAGGQLVVGTPVGGFEDEAPYAYQDTDGGRIDVSSAYALEEDGGHGYGFSVGPYDPTRELVLDPAVLVYAGFLGGAADDDGRGIAIDGAGNAYVTGGTDSSEATFPVTAGSFGTTFRDGLGRGDAYVAKVDPTGSALVYVGYIGGVNGENGEAIAVDAAGNAYVTGETVSPNLPVTAGAFDQTFNGAVDAFVAKVNPSGTALVYATYLGGAGSDLGRAIAVDAVGNAYIAGDTTSADFPVSVGAFDLAANGREDVFAFKLSATGAARVYGTYLGGAALDEAFGIGLDAAGNAYLTGRTYSAGFPTTAGAFDVTYNGEDDVFVTKLNPTGSALVYSTFLGGAARDLGEAIAIDGGGNAFVAGWTNSDQATFPATAGAFDVTANGDFDAFVAKLNPAGTLLVYATYLGGVGRDRGHGIAVDGSGNAYLTGEVGSSEATFPVTAHAFDSTYNGVIDAFVAKVNPAGSALVYASYLGGQGADYGSAIAVDATGNAYVTGSTASPAASFPATAGAFDATPGGRHDAFVAKVSESTDGGGGGGGPPPGGGGTADLRITKTDNATTVAPGGTVTYTIAVTNGGAVPVSGVTVADTFDATRLSSPSTTCAASAGSSCPAGPTSGNLNATVTLAPNGTATFTTTAQVLAGATGTLTNTATVAPPPGVTDPNPANNSATDTTAVGPGGGGGPADLAVAATASPSTVAPNGTVTYSLTATHVGGGPAAAQVRLILKLPPSITAADGSSPTGTCRFAAGTADKPLGRVLCEVGSLSPGASATATVTLNVLVDEALAATAIARPAVGAPADPVSTNNRRGVSVTVSP